MEYFKLIKPINRFSSEELREIFKGSKKAIIMRTNILNEKEFLKVFMLKGALITPWVLYIIGILFGISCLWQKGRSERKVISIAIFFFATVIMVVLVWPDNYRAMSELMKAAYYFPE